MIMMKNKDNNLYSDYLAVDITVSNCDAYSLYSDYIAEQLTESIEYTEYIAESIAESIGDSLTIDYSEYGGFSTDPINYAEYIAEAICKYPYEKEEIINRRETTINSLLDE
tara:strand:- start:58050 stop:58382 length:333 start_codon:yes stop_codon:yes gene_type:complete